MFIRWCCCCSVFLTYYEKLPLAVEWCLGSLWRCIDKDWVFNTIFIIARKFIFTKYCYSSCVPTYILNTSTKTDKIMAITCNYTYDIFFVFVLKTSRPSYVFIYECRYLSYSIFVCVVTHYICIMEMYIEKRKITYMYNMQKMVTVDMTT